MQPIQFTSFYIQCATQSLFYLFLTSVPEPERKRSIAGLKKHPALHSLTFRELNLDIKNGMTKK